MSDEAFKLQRRSDGGFVEADLVDGMVPGDLIVVGNEGLPNAPR